MSAPIRTVPVMFNPWRRLRALTNFELEWHDGGLMGETDHVGRKISLRRGLTWEQRRCTILHECLHAERGPVPGGLVDREELRVRKETARIMLPDPRAIGDAYAWAQGDDEGAASELGVDVDVLRTRLKYAHPAERGYFARRFQDHKEWPT